MVSKGRRGRRWPSGEGVPLVEDVVSLMQPFVDQITIDVKTYDVVRACGF